MVVMAESAGMSEIVAEHVGAVQGRKKKMASSGARTEFPGVRRNPSGTYGVQIWDPSKRAMLWLGTFGTAEEAAGVAAANKLNGQRLAAKKKPVTKKAAGRPDAAATAKKKKTAARPDAWTEFRGVHRMLSGKYGAQIRHSKGKARAWLGTFDAAEDAARAYDAAAVYLHGARAITNFKQPSDATATGGVSCEEKVAAAESSGQSAGSPTSSMVKGSFDTVEEQGLPTASTHGAAAVNLHGVAVQTSPENPAAPALVVKRWKSNSRSGFRGVSLTRSGNKYVAKIMDPVRRTSLWLGTFDTAEEAAGAYDAAAVRLHGANAITNFEQQSVAAAAATNNGDDEDSFVDILNDFFSDTIIPGPQLDNLWTDLPSAKEEQMVDVVDEFLNDMDLFDVVA